MAAHNKEVNVLCSGQNNDSLDTSGDSEQTDPKEMQPSASASSEAVNKADAVSIFCKNCFHPYNGVQKSGTFVLKCDQCGLTDTVLQEEASELDADEYVGNLMANKFLQAIREQEGMTINIGDPDFLDDNFKGLTGALSDFCIYLNYIASKMLQLATEERRESSEEAPETETVDRAKENDQKLMDGDKTESRAAEDTRQELVNLRASVLNVVSNLIVKYDLPTDIWNSIEYRINSGDAAGIDGDDDDSDDADAIAQYYANRLQPIEDDVDEEDLSNLVLEEGDERNKEIRDVSNNENNDNATETFEEKHSDGQKTTFGLEMAKVNEEKPPNSGFMSKTDDKGALEEVTGQRVETGVKRKNNNGGTNVPVSTDSTINETRAALLDREINQKLGSKFKVQHDDGAKMEPLVLSLLIKTKCIRNALAAKREKDERELAENQNRNETNAEPDEPESRDSQHSVDDTASENMEVDFQALTTAFLAELNVRKRRALTQRKKKAFELVGAKMLAIRQQVVMVERQIKRELHNAYESKMKKVDKQKQIVTEKQKDIENVEELLDHYIATGQMDKAADLMEMFESANQNN